MRRRGSKLLLSQKLGRGTEAEKCLLLTLSIGVSALISDDIKLCGARQREVRTVYRIKQQRSADGSLLSGLRTYSTVGRAVPVPYRIQNQRVRRDIPYRGQ